MGHRVWTRTELGFPIALEGLREKVTNCDMERTAYFILHPILLSHCEVLADSADDSNTTTMHLNSIDIMLGNWEIAIKRDFCYVELSKG